MKKFELWTLTTACFHCWNCDGRERVDETKYGLTVWWQSFGLVWTNRRSICNWASFFQCNRNLNTNDKKKRKREREGAIKGLVDHWSKAWDWGTRLRNRWMKKEEEKWNDDDDGEQKGCSVDWGRKWVNWFNPDQRMVVATKIKATKVNAKMRFGCNQRIAQWHFSGDNRKWPVDFLLFLFDRYIILWVGVCNRNDYIGRRRVARRKKGRKGRSRNESTGS